MPPRALNLALCVVSGTPEKQGHTVRCDSLGAKVPGYHRKQEWNIVELQETRPVLAQRSNLETPYQGHLDLLQEGPLRLEDGKVRIIITLLVFKNSFAYNLSEIDESNFAGGRERRNRDHHTTGMQHSLPQGFFYIYSELSIELLELEFFQIARN